MANNSEIFNFLHNSDTVTQITHLGDSSNMSLESDKLKGDGYYSRSDGIHTVQYNLNGFLGSIVVQGTLATAPIEEDWSTIASTMHQAVIEDEITRNGGFIKNFTGNYVWVRIAITNWSDGSVTSIMLNH